MSIERLVAPVHGRLGSAAWPTARSASAGPLPLVGLERRPGSEHHVDRRNEHLASVPQRQLKRHMDATDEDLVLRGAGREGREEPKRFLARAG